jgi:hypothetical protein
MTLKAVEKDALLAKYRSERDKRLRADGNTQYRRVADVLGRNLKDPYTPVTPRPPKTDHVTFAFIGGGFAGLVTGARLVEASLRRAGTSAALGTGTAIPEPSATPLQWSICPSSKRQDIGQAKNTPTPPKS